MIHKSYGLDPGPASTLFQVVCSSTWGISYLAHGRPMGLNALGYQSHVQQRRNFAHGHEAKIKIIILSRNYFSLDSALVMRRLL